MFWEAEQQEQKPGREKKGPGDLGDRWMRTPDSICPRSGTPQEKGLLAKKKQKMCKSDNNQNDQRSGCWDRVEV